MHVHDERIGLSPAVLEKVFPFHIAFGRNLDILQYGRGIKKICDEISIGRRLDQLFLLKAPDIALDYDLILEQSGNVFLLGYLPGSVVLKGQMTLPGGSGSDIMLFLGTPVVRDISSVRGLGLGLNDFAIHDSLIDLLILLQTKNNTISDVRTMAERLKKEVSDRREAEHSSQSKSFFLANMSHEIRTPMVGTLGMLELLEHTSLNETQRNYVGKAKSSAEILLSLINDILDFSKIEAGKLEMEHVGFDLRRCVEEAVIIFSERARKKGVGLDWQVARDVPSFLKGDPLRFRQVLTNLVGNAVKFTPKGKVSLVVNVAQRAESEVRLRVEVHDTGIGIPEAAQKIIFDYFSQCDGSTTRRFGGTGLGLAICKQLVEMMHGRISVSSTPGIGSLFSFTASFPIAEEIVERLDADAAGRDAAAAPGLTVRYEGNVLLVDDNPFNREVGSGMLSFCGLTVRTSSSAQEALAALAEDEFDLVFMDCQMPEMDGFQAAEAIRRGEAAGKRIPIVALTAYAMEGDREKCLQAGMDDYLAKPYTMQQLIDQLDRWLPGSPVYREALTDTASDRDAVAHGTRGIIDTTVLEQMRLIQSAGSPDLVQQLVEMYLEDAPQQIEALKQAIASGNAGEAWNLVHNLKSSSASLGAANLADLCKRLEAQARQHDMSHAAALCADIESEYKGVVRSLNRYLGLPC